MIIAAIIVCPLIIPILGTVVASPTVLLACFAVALLSTTIPFSLEYIALKSLTPRTYGILVSIEPAVATIIGALLLGERIGVKGAIAVACVVVAAIGVSLTENRA